MLMTFPRVKQILNIHGFVGLALFFLLFFLSFFFFFFFFLFFFQILAFFNTKRVCLYRHAHDVPLVTLILNIYWVCWSNFNHSA